MQINALFSVVIGVGLSLVGSSGLAHHGFATVFDAEKPFKLTGAVTKVEWQNPHAWFYIEVEDDRGNVTDWGMELATPNILMRRGWTRSSLKVGDVVTVEGFLARDGSNTGNATTVILNATGQSLFTGSSTGRREP